MPDIMRTMLVVIRESHLSFIIGTGMGAFMGCLVGLAVYDFFDRKRKR